MSGETKPRVKKDVYEKMRQILLDNNLHSFSKGVEFAMFNCEKFVEASKAFKKCEDDPFEFYERFKDILEREKTNV